MNEIKFLKLNVIRIIKVRICDVQLNIFIFEFHLIIIKKPNWNMILRIVLKIYMKNVITDDNINCL